MPLTDKQKKEEYAKSKEKFQFGLRAIEGGPKHVAIICDGNRRWAENNGMSVQEGHEVGAENVLRLLERSGELGVETLTVWVMDTKNFQKRSRAEIRNLLKIFMAYAYKFKKEYLEQDIRFRHTGARELLPKKLQNIINEIEDETKDRKTATLNVAFNYGGRNEIVRGVKKMLQDNVDPDEVTEELFSQYLDTSDMEDPDLIIRTGLSTRLSGFMSWQSAPSELEFPNYLFPDFTPDRYEEVIKAFPLRSRRFGK